MIFESIDFYADRWAKRKQDNLKYLSKLKERKASGQLAELKNGYHTFHRFSSEHPEIINV